MGNLAMLVNFFCAAIALRMGNAVKDFFVAGFARIRVEPRFIVARLEVLRLQLLAATPIGVQKNANSKLTRSG